MMPAPMHAPKQCAGTFCPFHNPSDHHMKDWPITVRNDRYGLTERLCVHGCGHPDPDSVTWLEKLNDPDYDPYSVFTTHGCDLCCFTNSEKDHIQKIRDWAHTHDFSAEMEKGHWESD